MLQRERPGRSYYRQQSVLFQVDTPVGVGQQTAEYTERRLPILGKPGQRRDKCGRGFRARVTVRHKVGGKCQLAVYRYCIEKDIGCQRLFGPGRSTQPSTTFFQFSEL